MTAKPTAAIRNLGPVSRQWLAELGVCTIADIDRVGPVAIWTTLKRLGRPVSWNLLWSLQAAIMDIDWRCLPSDLKTDLKQQVWESVGE